MILGEYLVTGKRNYRGHAPGTKFEARLAPGPEARAIARGDIRLLRRIEPAVPAGSYTFPDGWLTDAATTTRQNQGG